MTGRALLAACFVTAGAVLAPACTPHKPPAAPAKPPAVAVTPTPASSRTLGADLDAIFDDPVLARALVGVRIDALAPDAKPLYARNGGKLVMPASNMKVITLAVAAERLGWDYRFETRLEAAGTIDNGVLTGDLVLVGSGDPSIRVPDVPGPVPAFDEWIAALRAAGISRVDGRLIGDDDAFEKEGLGAGWSWDYLSAGYAAPSGALNYNLNQVTIRAIAAAVPGGPTRIDVSPAGSRLTIVNEVVTATRDTPANVELSRAPGSTTLAVRGVVPAGGELSTRASVDNPTHFLVEALRLALDAAQIPVRDGAWDLDEVRTRPPVPDRRVLAVHQSATLGEMAPEMIKLSLNFDSEILLKVAGRQPGLPATIVAGRDTARDLLTAWGLAPDSVVMYDASGLSRYDYVTADTIAGVLTHVWQDERLRGPFIASLPVAGRDGTLATRMRGTVLEGKVTAKTGTIANARSLSGYLETASGGTIVFAIIVNNFTAPNRDIDAVVERALLRLASQ